MSAIGTLLGGIATAVGSTVVGLASQGQVDVNFTIYGLFPFGVQLKTPGLPFVGTQSVFNRNLGGIPPPTRMRFEIRNKLVEVPIVGMDGNRLQHLGRRAPRVVFEGYFYYPWGSTAEMTFLTMTKTRKVWPFFTTLLPCFRMMQLDNYASEPVPGAPGDIKYTIELVQDQERGFP